MRVFTALRMLLKHGALEITTEAKNGTAIKSVVFADGDVICLTVPELVTETLVQTHSQAVKATINNTMLGASSLAKCMNYTASALGVWVFTANFSLQSVLVSNLVLALTCLVGSALGHLALRLLGRRLFSRVL